MFKNEIIEYYKDLCKSNNKKLSRSEYRKVSNKYSSSLIEQIWGNWTNFVEEASEDLITSRVESIKTFSKDIDRIVISFINDGTTLNEDCFLTLKNYCKINKAQLGILWGKNIKKNKVFNKDVFDLLSPYLATKFEFEKDKNCIAMDFLIPFTQKNPLMNMEKLTTDIKTIIVGSPKQYLKTLPYKQYTDQRIAWSTGTISNIDYPNTISGHLDSKNHTLGGILLTWNEEYKRYIPRNLIFKGNEICDLNISYTKNNYKVLKEISGIVLGDLHLPEEDQKAISKTKQMIKTLSPNVVMIHDIASWNSISHHEFNQHLTKLKNKNNENKDLETELKSVIEHLNDFVFDLKDINFKIVNSNHDDFINKWLETGEFIKDSVNAKIGAQLFIKYLEGKNILDGYLPKNVQFLPKNTSFEVEGFELSEHGDAGINGMKGSIASFNKGLNKTIIGHTHSPENTEHTIVVGTLSKLIVNYNQKGFTKWSHCNAIIHRNGTHQLIFI